MMNVIKIAIIGSGFAGTATTVRLLSWIPKGSCISIFEKKPINYAGGLAYNDKVANPKHFLNLQAGRISLYREKRDDFLKWANKDANRTTWPEVFSELRSDNFKFERWTGVPRVLYQKYLIDRRESAIQLASLENISVRKEYEEVVSIKLEEKTVITSVSEKNGKYSEQIFDYVIICTGNVSIKRPPALIQFLGDPRVIFDQYSLEACKKLRSLPVTPDILIVGTGMRAYDVLIEIDSSLPPKTHHEGHIFLCSPHGRFHPKYATNHVHDIIQIPRPSFLDDPPLTKQNVIDAIVLEFKHQYSERVDIPENIRAERIIKAWEKWLPELMAVLSPQVIKELQDEYWAIVTTLRIGVINEINDVVRKYVPQKEGIVLQGELFSVFDQSDGKLKVTIKNNMDGTSKEINVDLIVSCIGRETDYNKIESILWQKMIKDGIAVTHIKTGRGIETTWLGSVLDKKLNPIPSILAVGVMREGDETQRNGRVGSFVFSVGPIRNHAFQVAISILLKEQLGNDLATKLEIACEQNDISAALQSVLGDMVSKTELDRLSGHFKKWIKICILALDPYLFRLKSKDEVLANIISNIDIKEPNKRLIGSVIYGCAMLFALRELCDIHQITSEVSQ